MDPEMEFIEQFVQGYSPSLPDDINPSIRTLVACSMSDGIMLAIRHPKVAMALLKSIYDQDLINSNGEIIDAIVARHPLSGVSA